MWSLAFLLVAGCILAAQGVISIVLHLNNKEPSDYTYMLTFVLSTLSIILSALCSMIPTISNYLHVK